MSKCLIKSGAGYLIEFDYNRNMAPVLTTNIDEATEFFIDDAIAEIKHLSDHGWYATIMEFNDSTLPISVKEAKRKKIDLEYNIKALISAFEQETFTTVNSININEFPRELGRNRSFSIQIDVNL